MSILNTLYQIGILTRAGLYRKLDLARSITSTFARHIENSEQKDTIEGENAAVEDSNVTPRLVVSVETSIKYMKSDAYKQTYGDEPVWKPYRRNYKGQFAPKKTRRTCIRGDDVTTGSPCPICRDEYLVLDYRNVKLLEQFISKHNGSILSYSKTGVCQKKHKQLLVAITRAKDYGTITFDTPARTYDYSEWQEASN